MTKVTAVFTISPSTIGQMISWGLGQRMSHCGLKIEFGNSHLIVHSDLGGLQVDPVNKFLVDRIILAELPTNISPDTLIAKMDEYANRKYDLGGFAYWALRILGTKLFGLPTMKRNLWAAPRAFLCSELLADLLGEDTTLKAFSPYDVYQLLASSSPQTSEPHS